jgi:dTMP kinase
MREAKKLPGFFISLEGPEGAGKSTQAELLAENLKKAGLQVILTKEPGEGNIGGQIRRLILDPENTELKPKAEAMLYAADRAQHVESLLLPALAAGKIVICDRYVDSNLAYQGYGRGMDLDFLLEINQMATEGLMPELTVFLDLAPEAGLKRALKRSGADRMEQEKLDFHQRLYQGYKELAAKNPERIAVIKADQSQEEIAGQIEKICWSALKQKGIIRE